MKINLGEISVSIDSHTKNGWNLWELSFNFYQNKQEFATMTINAGVNPETIINFIQSLKKLEKNEKTKLSSQKLDFQFSMEKINDKIFIIFESEYNEIENTIVLNDKEVQKLINGLPKIKKEIDKIKGINNK